MTTQTKESHISALSVALESELTILHAQLDRATQLIASGKFAEAESVLPYSSTVRELLFSLIKAEKEQ